MFILILKKISDINLLTSLFAILFIGIFLFNEIYKMKLLPPGPWGLPIFGFVSKSKNIHLHLKFQNLAKKYGAITSVRLSSNLYIVLSDYKVIRKVFSNSFFTGRPKNSFMNIIDGYGIVNCDGKLWQTQRKFLHQSLKSFGMTLLGNKNFKLEEQIKSEVRDFLRAINEKNMSSSGGIDLNSFMAVALSNVICNILMSVRFSYNDDKFYRFMFLIEEGFQLFSSLELFNYIPIIRNAPFLVSNRYKLEKNRTEMADFVQAIIDEHRKTFDSSRIRDVVDAYLLEIENAVKNGTEKSLFEGKNHDRQIQQIVSDVFSAGMETIKTTMLWAVLYMIHYPDAMRDAQNELDRVIGRDRLPTLDDMHQLPLVEATICETLRSSSVVPLGTSHAATRDVLLNGYRVPQNTEVIPLIYAVHNDPELWTNPEEFNPGRFLNADGKVQKPAYFIPFGSGRRMCLGQTLANMELFLFFASLLHSYDFEVPAGAPMPSLKPNFGATLTPNHFKVRLVPRRFECGNVLSLESPVVAGSAHDFQL